MTLSPDDQQLLDVEVGELRERLDQFLQPFLAVMLRSEHRQHARVYIAGRIPTSSRRTTEPIARQAQTKIRPLQHFLGAGRWSDTAVRTVLRHQVKTEMGSPKGVLIADASGFPKSGPHSVGTARQWCGRLGKVEQCQVGEFLSYASKGSVTLIDAALYLPKAWAEDTARREECGVPTEVKFQTGWELSLDLIRRHRRHLPHCRVVADEAYGRPAAFRDGLRRLKEAYLVEVERDTKLRLARGGEWTTAEAWVRTVPAREWETVHARDGEKGPVELRAVKVRVFTARTSEKGKIRPDVAELLLIVRNERANKTWTYLATDDRASLKELVRVANCRSGVEYAFGVGKGEVGLDEYEVRSWTGWHHHMTLCMVAQWFLIKEQRWLKKGGSSSPLANSGAC